MLIKQISDWASANPKRLFQIDGFGAILSAILLGVVLVRLEGVFGIPKTTLYFLASLPCLFAIYDFFCYFKLAGNWGIFLKGIAISNLTYCFLSMGMAFYHRAEITNLGWTYILIEISIVGMLAYIEWSVATNLQTRP
ncbi:MAG: hypothetical protein KDC80_15170 [Saprospiraceae bacterium]|nr:hypothetical protein [Saprospiraceae bacterium]